MTPLEQRYRRLLRLLPASYRQAWEQDMVATFLDGAVPDDDEDAEFAAEYGRPDGAEVRAVVALAVRLRLGGDGAPPRYLAWGEAVRRVATVGLLLRAVAAVAGVALLLWTPVRHPDLAGSDRMSALWAFAALLWVPAYVLLVVGSWATARVLAVVALLPDLAHLGVELFAGGPYLATHTIGLLVQLLPVLALAAFHRDSVALKPRPWLVALPVAAVAQSAVLVVLVPLAVLAVKGLRALPSVAPRTAAAGLPPG